MTPWQTGPDYSPANAIRPKSMRPAKRRAIYDAWLSELRDNEVACEIRYLEDSNAPAWQISAAKRELDHRL